MLISRIIGGLALLLWLGPQYLTIVLIARVWRAPTRPWRRWLDRHGARLLVAHIQRHGALLIKVGQFIASRPDVFPLAYVDACAPLRDQAPARPFSAIAPVLDDAYEGHLREHLPHIDEQPLASASFGQVHKGKLADGREVAIKIQYPGLASSVAADLWLIRLTLKLFSLILRGWPLHQIYDEIKRTSRDEQDYLHEGTAADRLRPGLARFGIKVPTVIWEHTREKVLVMEFAHGVTFAQLDVQTIPTAERRRLADIIIDGFLFMLLDEGFFHADPHGGNLIYDNGTLWLLDFGMTSSITRRETELYRRFLERLRENDTDGMVDVLSDLGWVLPTADRAHLKGLAREVYDSLAHLDPQSFKGSRRQAELGAKIAEFLRRMDGIVFPQHTVLLSRATSLVEGNCMKLVPGVNLLDLVRPRLNNLTTLGGQLRAVKDELKQLWRTYRALPDKIDALLAQKRPAFPLLPVLSAILLIAVILCQDSNWRTAGIIACLSGVVIGVFKR